MKEIALSIARILGVQAEVRLRQNFDPSGGWVVETPDYQGTRIYAHVLVPRNVERGVSLQFHGLTPEQAKGIAHAARKLCIDYEHWPELRAAARAELNQQDTERSDD